MTRKDTRNTSALRGIAPFIAVLTVMIALAALAQTRRAGLVSGKSHAGSAPNAAEPPTAGPMGPAPPSFLPAVNYDSGGFDATSVAVADVNGDGKPDLLVVNLCINNNNDCAHNLINSSVGVFLGNGDGTFQTAVSYYSGGFRALSIAVADVNGDGKPDILVTNDCSNSNCDGSVGVLLGNGDGTFRPAVVYGTGGTQAFSGAIADVNGDGKPDFVVANTDSGTVGVLLGNGDGTFQPVVTYDSGGGGPDSIAVADVNGDGKPDLVVANQCTPNCNGTVGILLGNGDGTFQTATTYGSGGQAYVTLVVGDVNADGKPDVVTSNHCAGPCANDQHGVLGVLLGNGDGTFQAAVNYGSGGYYARGVVIADVNGDGKPDMVATNLCSVSPCGSVPVGVLFGNGDGTFQSAVVYNSGGYSSNSLTVADVDGNGEPDVVVANYCLTGGNICQSDGSVSVLLHVGAKLTTTTLASSLNPSIFGQVVTFTAKVKSAAGTPTGIVVFFDGSTALGNATLANGNASVSTSLLGAGSRSITAVYQGSQKFNSSASASFTQVVNAAMTTTSLASSQNPAVITEFVTYTAAVASHYGGAATGTVAFQDGSKTVATVTLAGNQAAYRTKYSLPSTHSIAATYSGDTNNTGSLSSTLVEQINQGFASTTVLTTSGSPSFVGQSVTFTATVSSSHGAIPDGEQVTFFDGATTIGTGSTASGVATFTTSSLTAKTHTIKASYPGDAIFRPSTGPVTQVVNKYTTTTTLSSSPNPSQFGQKVTFTAQVTSSGPAPTGKVAFRDGTTGIGSATLSGGVATFTRSTLAVGTHSITAHYNGDAASSASTSPVVNQVVQ